MHIQEQIPKTIWMLWLQGLENAPFLVQKCYDSWKKHNPGWEIRFLDQDTMHDYVDIRPVIEKNQHGISKAAMSDVLRINLLKEFGGVWADATCLCVQPLDNWLESHAAAGFFAFYGPGRDRIFDSWFLAASKNCYLVDRQCESVNHFFSDNEFNYERRAKWDKKLEAVVELHKYLSGLSFSFLVKDLMKIYPYFWFHYLFNQNIWKDQECRRIWEATKMVDARIPLKLQHNGMLKPLSPSTKLEIDAGETFLHKLNWKYDASQYNNQTVLAYLLATI